MSHIAPEGTVLCALDDLDATGAKGLFVGEGAARQNIFVVREEDAVFGYVNSCPHIGVPLEFEPDEFISEFGGEILCSTHGARFRIEDGYCVSGPCSGDALEPVAVKVVGGNVVMA
ncbi:Rieske (2Fe-2S) protein [Thalassospira sp. MCCC 1A01428]|uniref:Rieske (2Fe-2S) protein n=1 Tax=Thalassospira sp. MCCC 1A01428 TaxID=1470575 RepID=UPI000A1E6345|nr:Rieske (2Fe-2S) protein [Thalassospira sp. MCCC 1A01428]OSQ43937.1 (2Fe-2S)-binding protein [Thalassospira sp. MCCC 1A01428]